MKEKEYTLLEAFEELDSLDDLEDNTESAELEPSDIIFVDEYTKKEYTVDEFKELLTNLTEFKSFRVNNLISVAAHKSSNGLFELEMWDQNGRSAGSYNLPEDSATFFNNLNWVLADKQHSVCCECRKQLATKGIWHPFVGNYCKECDAVRVEDDWETTDWWN